MSRLPDPTADLQGEDLELYKELIAKRGRIDGMYRTLLNHPELTRKVSELGSYLRFESTLPGDIREFIILYSAEMLQVSYEWQKHLQPALDAGLDEVIIKAVEARSPLPDPYSTIALGVKCASNLEEIPAPLQEKLVRILTVKGLLELVVLAGFYRMIAGIIKTFDVPDPEKNGQ